MKKSGIIALVSVLVIIAGIIICFGAMYSLDFDFEEMDTESTEKKSYSISEDFNSINIRGAEADVKFVYSNSKECRVEVSERKSITHTVEVENGVLNITRKDNRRWYEHISFGFFWSWKNVSITLYLPETSYNELDIVSLSGDVRIPSGFEFKDTMIQNTSGDIVFESKSTENLELKSVSGEIFINSQDCREIILASTSGDLKISDCKIKGSLKLNTVSGDIEVKNIKGDELSAASTSGEVDIEDSVFSGNLELKTTSGDIQINSSDAKTLNIKSTSGDVKGNLLSDKMFVTHSTSGNIRVPESHSDDRCEIKTTSGDIRMEIR